MQSYLYGVNIKKYFEDESTSIQHKHIEQLAQRDGYLSTKGGIAKKVKDARTLMIGFDALISLLHRIWRPRKDFALKWWISRNTEIVIGHARPLSGRRQVWDEEVL